MQLMWNESNSSGRQRRVKSLLQAFNHRTRKIEEMAKHVTLVTSPLTHITWSTFNCAVFQTENIWGLKCFKDVLRRKRDEKKFPVVRVRFCFHRMKITFCANRFYFSWSKLFWLEANKKILEEDVLSEYLLSTFHDLWFVICDSCCFSNFVFFQQQLSQLLLIITYETITKFTNYTFYVFLWLQCSSQDIYRVFFFLTVITATTLFTFFVPHMSKVPHLLNLLSHLLSNSFLFNVLVQDYTLQFHYQ